jgi:hypothetical protein
MISEPIAFVLGAGSMKDYGFPIGWELVREVVDQFGPRSEMRALLLKHTVFEEAQLDAFVKSLHASGQNSVDAFLEERSDFFDAGAEQIHKFVSRECCLD